MLDYIECHKKELAKRARGNHEKLMLDRMNCKPEEREAITKESVRWLERAIHYERI
jgi:hypothetical protein